MRNKKGQFVKGNESYWKGKKRPPFSEEWKRKIRTAFLGKKHSKETRKKLSIAKQGDKHPGWKGGISVGENRKTYREKENKKWKKKNYNKVIFYNERRRVKKMQTEGSHTLGEWENLKAQYNWTCLACGKKEPGIKLTEDHIIPLIKGGSDNIENIQPLCRSCNCKKHTNIIRYITLLKVDEK